MEWPAILEEIQRDLAAFDLAWPAILEDLDKHHPAYERSQEILRHERGLQEGEGRDGKPN
jgi:hypothetical protein